MLSKVKQERFVFMDIFIALIALEIMSYFYYGFRAVMIAGLCVTASFGCEYFSTILMGKKFTADNLSCVNDGLIIALMMPSTVDWKIPFFAGIFASVAGKNIFGGRRNMIFSPAAVGYLFAFTSWKNEILKYPSPFAKTDIFESSQKLVDSASHTFNTTGKLSVTDYDILMGNFVGPMGAVSILLLAISLVFLLLRRDLSAGSVIGFLCGTAIMGLILPVGDNTIESLKLLLATNMTLFSAVFIISDKRTAPQKIHFGFFYGMFIALTSYVLLLITGIENLSVIIAVLFTPVALALRQLETKIDELKADSAPDGILSEVQAKNAEIAEEFSAAEEKISDMAENAIEEINQISNEVISSDEADFSDETSESEPQKEGSDDEIQNDSDNTENDDILPDAPYEEAEDNLNNQGDDYNKQA